MTTERRRSAGFTLFELIVAMVVLGLLTMMLSPFFKMFLTAKQQTYLETQAVINQKIAKGLVDYARQVSPTGQLPAPYTGSGYHSTVADPAATQLVAQLIQTGLSPRELNADASTAQRVRVYQRVTGLTLAVPLYFQSGPQVTLTYEFGAVYMSACPKSNTGPICNPNPSLGIPGDSPVMTAANYQTWTSTGNDLPAVLFSSLPVQKEMLAMSSERLDRVRDSMGAYFRAKVLSAAASDTTNWFPTGPTSLGGRNPATNQGCRDGWYDLSATNILDQVGLTREEAGVTAWGGRVEYCRDYDPTGTSGPNAAPHYAALRINKDLSAALAPDNSIAANNIILGF